MSNDVFLIIIVVVCFICIYIAAFAWLWGPLGWVVPNEIFPLEIDSAMAPPGQLVPTGTCVSVKVVLKVPPEGTKQKIELRFEKVIDIGLVDQQSIPCLRRS